jgi:hypothetical protein
VLHNLFYPLYRRNAVLAIAGLSQLLIAIILLPLLFLDSREVLGINVWIKPIKFLLSATIYLWTLAILLAHLKNRYPRSVRFISWTFVLTMIIENGAITMQAARGIQSHFNESNLVDGVIFGVMGLFIMINTFAVLYTALLFFRASFSLPTAYIWGIRLGFVLFILGSAIGGAMIGAKSHNIGVDMGGAGLPFVNWSVLGGDLRVAHFLGLHALQIIPLAGYLLSRSRITQRYWATIAIVVTGLMYGLIIIGLYQQAMSGRPLLSFLP